MAVTIKNYFYKIFIIKSYQMQFRLLAVAKHLVQRVTSEAFPFQSFCFKLLFQSFCFKAFVSKLMFHFLSAPGLLISLAGKTYLLENQEKVLFLLFI